MRFFHRNPQCWKIWGGNSNDEYGNNDDFMDTFVKHMGNEICQKKYNQNCNPWTCHGHESDLKKR